MSQQEIEDNREIRAPDVLPSAGTTDISSLPENLRSESDRVRWFFLKNLKRHGKFYPSAEKLFVKKFKKNTTSIKTIDFLRTVANLCMIETGLVPLTPKKIPICPVEELLSLSVSERMVKLTDSLMAYFDNQSKLDVIHYTYIAAKDVSIEKKFMSPVTSSIDERSAVKETSKFEYSTDSYKFLTWHSGEKIFVTLKGHKFDMTSEIDRMGIWTEKIKIKDTLPIQDFILNFEVDFFLSQMKTSLCYVFSDKFNALSNEYQAFRQLPDELVENLSRYLDGRSLVKFSQTCQRMNRILDSDAVWELQCRRIREDFSQYGYAAPTEETLRSRLTEEGSHKEKYKALYVRARTDYRELRLQRNWNNFYDFRFGDMRHGRRRVKMT